MLGIDVYQRHNEVTDWRKVSNDGVNYVYVKGTDGGGIANVDPAYYVHGAQTAGLPVGLYHYAQPDPGPETQADVLAQCVRDLGADNLPPALDLEDPFVPNERARQFAWRFLHRLQERWGFRRVTLYGNLTMLGGIGAANLNLTGLWHWIASYGPNDGTRHPLVYPNAGIHQYTSKGVIQGISRPVDLDWAFPSARLFLPEDDMMQQVMPFEGKEGMQYHHIPVETRSVSSVVGDVWFSISSGYSAMTRVTIFFNGFTKIDLDKIEPNVRRWWPVPNGCESISWQYDCPSASGACLTTGRR